MARAADIDIAGCVYRVRSQDTLRWQRARAAIETLPPVLSERKWVAAWIELIDASVMTPRGTPRAGRLLRELYLEDAIRLRDIRDTGMRLLPPLTTERDPDDRASHWRVRRPRRPQRVHTLT